MTFDYESFFFTNECDTNSIVNHFLSNIDSIIASNVFLIFFNCSLKMTQKDTLYGIRMWCYFKVISLIIPEKSEKLNKNVL